MAEIFGACAPVEQSQYNMELPASGNSIYTLQTLSTLYLDQTDDDVDLKQLLKSWKLEHLSVFLISEKITIDVLKVIKQHHISALFKNHKIGEMVLFEHNLDEWKKTVSTSHSTSNSSSQTSSSQSPNIGSPTESRDTHETLSDILNEVSSATVLTDFYNEHSRFTENHRNMLTKIICNYFDENQLQMSLHTSYRLEQEILDRFPTEKAEYYRTGKRGKIYVKSCNIKANLKSLKRSSSGDIFKTLMSNEVTTKAFSPERNSEEYVRSLRFDNLSVDEFDSCWQACSQFRLNEINQSSSLTEVLQKWPEYSKPSGYRYMDKDFGIIFDNRVGVLADWLEQLKKIRNFLLEDNHIKDKGLRSMLTDVNIAETDNDIAAVQILWCLHGYLIPLKKLVKKDNNNKNISIKYTIKSSQEAFLFVGRNTQEIEEHISFLRSKSECIQPFVLAIGDKDLKSLKQYFLYLDGIKFEFKTFLRALDICFKSFHLFYLKYPLECNHFWSFIEEYFYNIKISKNKSSKVSIFLDKLKATND